MSLSIDLQPLWDSVNTNFPIFLGILAIPAGIGIAIALANFIIMKVREAFK
jgi:hypothetical protein